MAKGIFHGAKHLANGVNCISGGIFSLPIQLLDASFGLSHLAASLRLGVASCVSNTFFDFSAEILSGSTQAIFIHSGLSHQQNRDTGATALTAPAGDPDQNSHTYGDSEGNQRAVFNFHGNPVEGVVAYFPSEFDRLVAKSSRLVHRNAPTTSQPISNLVQDRGNGVANLMANSRRPNRRLPARVPPDLPQLFLDGTKMVLDGGG
jgi:hypothetical protein